MSNYGCRCSHWKQTQFEKDGQIQEKKSVNLRVEIGMASGWNSKDLDSLLGKMIPYHFLIC